MTTSPRHGQRKTPSRRALLAIFTAATAIEVWLSARVSSGRPILGARWALLWLLAAWSVVCVVAVAAGIRASARWALPLGLVAAAVIRLAALAGPPTTSDDLFRYAWDGHVQAAGMDPYRVPPSAPTLARLRERWLWPDAAGCAALHRPVGCTRINRPEVRTIYPPVAEAWFAVVYRVAGIGARHKAWQVAGLVVDLVTVGLLGVILGALGRDRRWLLLYALCPAPVLEFVNNGHVDGLAVAFVAAATAVAVAVPTSERRAAGQDIALGALLGAAALVKIYPALLMVAVLCLPRRRPWLSLLRAGAAAAALALLTYAPHVLAVGVRVVGYLPGYLREERYAQGGRFLLIGLFGLSGWAADAVAALAVTLALAWVWRRRPSFPLAATVLLVAVMLTATPVQPWYAVSALAMATLVPWPTAALVVVAGYPYFFAVILDAPATIAIGRISYGIAAVAMAARFSLINPTRTGTTRQT